MATDRVRLQSRLYDIIDLQQDQILFIPMCAKCVQQIEALDRSTEAADARDVVMVV
jgi:CRISPR-associated protein Cas2